MRKMMRATILSCLLFAACSDAPNRQEFTNEQIAQLLLRDRVLAVEQAIGRPVAMPDLRPLADRVTALEATVANLKAPPVPHLLAYAGTAQEMDLGVGAPGSLCAINPTIGETFCFASYVPVYFVSNDCSGDGYIADAGNRARSLYGAASGAVLRRTGPGQPVTVSSALGDGAPCMPLTPQSKTLSPTVEIARFPYLAPIDLSVSLR